MNIEFGIQPNCSEVAFVVYKDKLNKSQLNFVERFFKEKKLVPITTPKGNLSVEFENKQDVWAINEKFHEIAKFLGFSISEESARGVRDDAYYDLIENGEI